MIYCVDNYYEEISETPMPRDITLDELPVGYSITAARAGEQCEVQFRGFVSTEDGQKLISRLEGTPAHVLEKIAGLSASSAASATSSLLTIIRPDKTATVYWNEFYPTMVARTKEPIEKDGIVTLNHIIDIERIKIPEGMISPDVGLSYVFSFGWRKGYFFDYGPLLHGENRQAREYDLEATLGHFLARLLFQQRFSISEEAWAEMFRQGWFPFSHLGIDVIESIIGYANAGFSIDDLLDNIANEVTTLIRSRLPEWRKNHILSPHVPFVETAFERYSATDYISSNSILYPRIEGIIRTYHSAAVPAGAASQSELCKTAAGHYSGIREESLLLPRRFKQYLGDFYFARFQPSMVVDSVSRNTVAHGVVVPQRMDRKAATVGFLILLQLLSAAGASAIAVSERDNAKN